MPGKFTGYHATVILVGFFAIVIAVNFWMARLATTTFGGALAENGYVASQDYNKWIAQSAAQDRLRWTLRTHVENGRLFIQTKGVSDAAIDVVAEHPLGRMDNRQVAMIATDPSSYRSQAKLPSGRWKLRVIVSKGGASARYLAEIRS